MDAGFFMGPCSETEKLRPKRRSDLTEVTHARPEAELGFELRSEGPQVCFSFHCTAPGETSGDV